MSAETRKLIEEALLKAMEPLVNAERDLADIADVIVQWRRRMWSDAQALTQIEKILARKR